MKKLMAAALSMAALAAMVGTADAKQASRTDADNNGYADVGVVVTRHWTSLYAYDASGAWFWDLGDGRVQGTVDSVDDLDQSTLSRCDYVNSSRGTFENDPYQDTGWIQNHIVCSGHDGHGTWNYLMVHESDPRYTGNPDWAIWGTWEYKVLTQSGDGNLVAKPVG